MKYWVFQNNQVIGPYDPEDLSRLVAFTPESLVCSEGRKGTSMGDWQRAGMVPDLSVALVKSGQRHPARGGLAMLSGLPPEPTLKDLAVLGSLQEKVAMLEDVAAQLQESLRQKEAELSSVHGALSDKDREAREMRAEAEKSKQAADELKRQLAGLEERLSGVAGLSETLDKAVEAEKQVQGDVLKQGETIAALSRELESLRQRLDERGSSSAASSAPPPAAGHVMPPAPAADAPFPSADAPSPFAPAAEAPAPFAPPSAEPAPFPSAPEALDIGTPLSDVAPPQHIMPPAPSPAVPAFDIEMPSIAPAPGLPETPAPAFELPSPAVPGFDFPASGTAAAPSAAGVDPLLSAAPFPAPSESSTPSLAPEPSAPPVVDLMAPDTSAPKPKKGKALLVGAALGAVAVGAAAYFGGFIPGFGPEAPAPVAEAPMPAPEPVPPPAPVIDPRQEAVAFAKGWGLGRGQTLGSKLDAVAPASGSLSPWMAEALPDGRIQVNYFASGAAAGSPTIAYEFVVDLAGKTLSGRNAAAKSILTGKLPIPPKPVAARPVRVKPKAKPAAAPADDESLDSLLGGDDAAPAKPAAKAKPAPAAGGLKLPGYDGADASGAEAAAAPAEDSSVPEEAPLQEPEAAPAPKPKAKGRPSRGGKKAAADDGKASDEALLDDLLAE